MIVPVVINGVELSFLLDTGVTKPIIFNFLNVTDSLQINNVETIQLRGLGGGEPIEALRSRQNVLKIGDAINISQDLFVIIDQTLNFTPKLGTDIHGIIGYDLFKDFIVEINYQKKHIILHDPNYYTYKECKKCEVFNLTFNNKKPYLDAIVGIRDKNIPIKLLIDSGGSDDLWLFEDIDQGINLDKEPYFRDFLGFGLSGDVHGKRSKVNTFKLKSFELSEVNVAFPDSASIRFAQQFSERDGSIAGGLLRRFNMIVDYKNAKLTIKKNSHFKDPFYYNKSGIVLEQQGLRVVKDLKRPSIENLFPSSLGNTNPSSSGNNTISMVQIMEYSLQPAFTIVQVRENSPAEKAGLLVGDVVISINNKDTSKHSLQEVNGLFHDKDGKIMSLKIERDGLLMKYKFRLKNVFEQQTPQ
ncbi:aspartyl protease family protein [Aegicerativicinus sediminis]|uniref:aspartyl protease family protein n=1 Tax=Aegicerativicinus sediminis TaxID=2893202 RepID=UPI001E610F10|nr:aspartyl protease family protein [Aegicerativicinus sediminis]